VFIQLIQGLELGSALIALRIDPVCVHVSISVFAKAGVRSTVTNVTICPATESLLWSCYLSTRLLVLVRIAADGPVKGPSGSAVREEWKEPGILPPPLAAFPHFYLKGGMRNGLSCSLTPSHDGLTSTVKGNQISPMTVCSMVLCRLHQGIDVARYGVRRGLAGRPEYEAVGAVPTGHYLPAGLFVNRPRIWIYH